MWTAVNPDEPPTVMPFWKVAGVNFFAGKTP